MAYVYADVASLPGSPPVGNQQCAILVEHFAGAPAASLWHQGVVVRGNFALATGTAIATFVNGRYPDASTGNHAALYVSQDSQGLWVVDQWRGSAGIHKRRLRFKGKRPNGSFVDPSNNGDAFSVIE